MIIVDANLLIYAVNRDDPRHGVVRRWWEALLSGHRAALAIENGATVASADGDFARFEQVSLVDPLRPDRAP